MESGWPTDRASVPESVRPYWDVRSELKSHEGLLYKQDRVVIPTVLRSSIQHKLHAAHRGPDFTLRHARNTVFWPGLTPQVKDMCTNCPTCAQHTQQHPLKPVQPYPVPKLPWQLVLQYPFGPNGQAYHVIVDHYSDYYEVDHLLTTQSTAVIQATNSIG